MAKKEAMSQSQQQRDPGGAPAPAGDAPRSGRGARAAARPAPAPLRTDVRYPNAYVWFIFLSALDVMLTYLILHPVVFAADADGTESRGAEVNALANWFIQRWDVPGMVAFKFGLVLLVVVLCEIIGRYRSETGRRLAEWAVAITSIPVIVALVQMALDLYLWFYPPH